MVTAKSDPDLELEERLIDLLEQAVELAPERRRSFLEQACGDNDDLLHEALELLAHEQRGDRFLEDPAELSTTKEEELGVAGHDPQSDSGMGLAPSVEPPDLLGKMVRQFRIVELLGQGGMGDLYIGFDEVLRRQVAIKAIRSAQSLRADARALFLREARILSQLEHPNICRIYEYIEEERADFLVMELIRGRTLQEALNEKLSGALKLRFAKQIARGLAAAHSKGVVHCDLKPANIMLSERHDAKILDFGIASVRFAQEGAAEISGATWRPRHGMVVGTPGYMSPEQARGEPVAAPADVFALGLLLQELFTGRPAYDRESSANLFVRMICGKTEPIQGLAPGLLTVISETLAIEPAERPSASEVAEKMHLMTVVGSGVHNPEDLVYLANRENPTRTLTEDLEPTRREAEVATASRLTLGLGGAAILILVLLAIAAGWKGSASKPEPAPVASSAAAPAVAPAASGLVAKRVMVIPFENRTGEREFDSLGVIIADWLTQGLSRAGKLDVVPLDLAVRSARFVAQQAGGDGPQVDQSAVARETGSGIVISGAYYRQKEELILRGQLTDIAAGKILSATRSLRTPISDPIGVLEDLEENVRARVATHLDRQLTMFGDLVTRPPTYEAYEAYVSGIEQYWRLDFAGALESLGRAAEIAPEFAAPRLISASALTNLGRFAEVQAIIDGFEAQHEKLAPQDRLYLNWLAARCRGDRAGAVQVASQALDLFPRSQWAQILGVDAILANLPAQAAAALAVLTPDRGYLRGWAAHFYYLTVAWHLLGEHARELEDARRGRRLYPDSLAVMMAEARALAVVGEEDQLFDLLGLSESLPRKFVHTPGSVMTMAAMELEAHGRPKAAGRAAEMAVEWYRRRSPEEISEAFYREGLGRALFVAERFGEAEEVFADLARMLPQSVDYMGYLGVLATIRGDRSALETLARLRALDRPYLFGKHQYWQAAILAWRGDIEGATDHLRRAVSAGHPLEWPELHPHIDPIWRPLRNDPTFLEITEPRG